MTDIWGNNEPAVIPAETPDTDPNVGSGVVLDLSGEDFTGSTYETIPVGTYVRVRVYDSEQRVSKAGNNMYVLQLAVLGDEWGKNRRLRSMVVLSTKALPYALPALAALAKPATFNGASVKTQRELAQAHKAAGGKGELKFPDPNDLLDIEVFAKVTEHREGSPDEAGNTRIFEGVELVSINDSKALQAEAGGAPKENPYKG